MSSSRRQRSTKKSSDRNSKEVKPEKKTSTREPREKNSTSKTKSDRKKRSAPPSTARHSRSEKRDRDRHRDRDRDRDSRRRRRRRSQEMKRRGQKERRSKHGNRQSLLVGKEKIEKPLERERGILFVRVEKAKDLLEDQKKDYADIYTSLTCDYNKQKFSTKVIKKTSLPEWNVEFNFITLRLQGKVFVKVFSRKKFKSTLLGEVEIDVSEIREGINLRKWYVLQTEKKKQEGGKPRKILITMYYQGQIEVVASADTFESGYQIEEELGTGGFSTVYKCVKRETNEVFAVKVIDKHAAPDEIEFLRREIEIMKSLKSSSIISLENYFEDDDTIHLVLEFAEGGELFEEIMEVGVFPEEVAAGIIKQILVAVSYLHLNGIAHRDLKPENLLITRKRKTGYTVKVSDFGLSKDFDNDTLQTSCGTPDYVAPEVLLGMPYDNSVDIWSVGVIAYILLAGFPPFFGDDDQEVFGKILQADYSFPSPDWDNISNEAKNFIGAILKLNYNVRPNAEDCLKSPWLRLYS